VGARPRYRWASQQSTQLSTQEGKRALAEISDHLRGGSGLPDEVHGLSRVDAGAQRVGSIPPGGGGARVDDVGCPTAGDGSWGPDHG
jgi:hypothetical protein